MSSATRLDLHHPQPLCPGQRQHWGGLTGAAPSLVLAQVASTFAGLTLLITENSRQAERLHAELGFFLEGSDLALELLTFPDWETLPYDNFSPHQDIISARLQTLHRLPAITRGVLILSITTLLHRLPPRAYIAANTLSLQVGQHFELNAMRRALEAAGYRSVDSVYEHGEFAVRGSIMDLFPMGSAQPYRIELFDDEIESLRTFSPDTQLSAGKVDAIRLLPGREYPLHQDAIAHFRRAFREAFAVDVRRCPLYEDISRGLASAGIEYYLPLFFPELASLFHYLPRQLQCLTYGEVAQGAEQFWREIRARYAERSVDNERPLLPPEQLFLAVEELFGALKPLPQLHLHTRQLEESAGHYNLDTGAFPDLAVEAKAERPLARLEHFLRQEAHSRILFCCDSPGRREAMLELLRRIDLHPRPVANWREFSDSAAPLAITVAPLESGLWLREGNLIAITENQLFTHHVSQQRRRGKFQDQSDFVFKSLTELSPGSPVVHLDHGVGRYLGLDSFAVEGELTEFLVLSYAEDAKLYVPVASLHLISRYSGGDPEQAPLHRLGSDQWQKAKRKAQEKIIDVAAELLDLHARRAAQQGQAFTLDAADYQLFTNAFPFEETEDQANTIAAVIADMQAPRPMDRLVCGDVGFGKTEVALRAAFIAVSNHKQVAVLVPTTLLAQQHYDTFRDRFADWPVKIALMSRFVAGKQQDATLQQLAEGQVDIVIGTHKLLQESLKYKALGLLIIDEEHRFGVRQKERLLALKASVDILTLTATPIPRTLNMAMSEMRDLSIIATPPARRLSVLTFVRQSNAGLIKEAIHRELLRGGQVFYLHNEVKTIDQRAAEIATLVPEARVAVGHGQLRESELERVMSDFYHKRHNVLVCSTIIETGIDIPSANTIIIDRADTFGLAQLHQLRGRVGRSHHQAYAYLLTPHPKEMTADASKRLDAISAADTLGAGFTLASHDLEIRGAGELLGEEQSGHMHTIGFALYSDMLAETVKLLKQGKTPNLDVNPHSGTEVNLRIAALLPDTYLPDVHGRLMMYKRIASAENTDELRELKVELIDRFGLLPEAAQQLFSVTALKLRAQALGISKVEANAAGCKLKFATDTVVDPYTLVTLVQKHSARYSLSSGSEFRLKQETTLPAERLVMVETLLDRLTPPLVQKS
ncbi:MAG: transcription-repair coupling factor [Pseudomonadales bacterium]|jgi:transcription-repair coupling factor (superfamily II helicase)|nr:transcription-repair coupling factor [Pseudomonadales bacterium]